MIVVDTSALITVLQAEGLGPDVLLKLDGEGELAISAGTMTEALIIAARRGYLEEMEDFISTLDIEIVPVTAETARQCAEAHLRWGAGRSGLNFGDCFAYTLAKSRNCPLLYVGDDFSQTDIASAI